MFNYVEFGGLEMGTLMAYALFLILLIALAFILVGAVGNQILRWRGIDPEDRLQEKWLSGHEERWKSEGLKRIPDTLNFPD